MKHPYPVYLITLLALCAPATAQTTAPLQTDDEKSTPIAAEIQIALPTDEAPTTGSFVKAYIIDNVSKMTAGNLADAFVGDIALENDKFKAVIARPTKEPIGNVRSGTLMDILRADAPVDYISSINTTVDPLSTGSVAIYNRGQIGAVQDGTTVSISLSGYIGDLGADAPPRTETIGVTTAYTLSKGSNLLQIDTTFSNETTGTAWIRPADAIDWGEARVFVPGSGYSGTTEPAHFAVGTVDDYSLGYFTSGTKPMEGLHQGRDSVILASGAIKDLEGHMQARKQAESASETGLPEEFLGVGASTEEGPGMIIFPGTETRYVMGPGGTPRLAPIYVPNVNIQYVDGKATVTLQNQSQTRHFIKPAADVIDSYVELAPGEKHTFTRFLSVSDGDWGAIARDAYNKKGIPTGTLAGAAMEVGTGKPLPDATIRISGGPDWDGSGRAPAMLQTKTREDGTYSVLLPEGKYQVNSTALGRRSISNEPPFDIKAGEAPKFVVQHLTKESVVRMAISEAETATSSPLPVKVTILSKPPFPTENFGFTPDISDGVRNTYYLPQGAAVFPLTPGRYRLVISRGIEYDILEKDISLAPGQSITVTGSLPHALKDVMQGMVSMDAGLVTDASGVGYANAESRAIQAACEGVEIIVSGDYNQVTDLQTAVRNQGLERWVKAFPGRRALFYKGGLAADVLMYPLDEETSAALDRALQQTRNLAPDIAIADLKEKFPNLIFEISRPVHPEAGYLEPFEFNERERQFVNNNMPPPDFDSIQLLEGKKLGLEQEIYPRYIAMQMARLSDTDLYEATPLSPIGSSLSKLPHGQEVGYPRTYLYVDHNRPVSEITAQDIVSTVKGQHYLVTNGPILFFEALDYETLKFTVRPGEIVDLSTTEVLRLRARVVAAPWITLEGINTTENGRRGITVLNIKPSRNVYRYPVSEASGSNICTRYLDSDTVVDAYCYSTLRSLAPVVPDALPDFGGEYLPYCFTGPIFVDKNGDGKIVIKQEAP